MAKFYGDVGFATSAETSPGVWTDTIIRQTYRGELIRESSNVSSSDSIAGEVTHTNRITIVMNTYAKENLDRIRFVELDGICWAVTRVEVRHPRLILTLGGSYHE